MALPSGVFEERYLIMMANLLKTVQAGFGVVLIERDHQLGAARRCPENDPDAANRARRWTGLRDVAATSRIAVQLSVPPDLS